MKRRDTSKTNIINHLHDIVLFYMHIKIILAQYLLRQSEAQSRVPLQLLVPQGNVKMRSVDHAEVQTHDRNLIRPLTQPRTCERDSFSFVAMSPLKFLSTTRASFLCMPSTERTNEDKCFCWLWQFLPFLYLFFLFQQASGLSAGWCL